MSTPNLQLPTAKSLSTPKSQPNTGRLKAPPRCSCFSAIGALVPRAGSHWELRCSNGFGRWVFQVLGSWALEVPWELEVGSRELSSDTLRYVLAARANAVDRVRAARFVGDARRLHGSAAYRRLSRVALPRLRRTPRRVPTQPDDTRRARGPHPSLRGVPLDAPASSPRRSRSSPRCGRPRFGSTAR